MKFILFTFIFISSLSAHSIVFVHIGDQIPDYVPIAMEQARLFNPDCPIYLIGNEDAFKRAPYLYCARSGLVNLEGHQNHPDSSDPSSPILMQYGPPYDLSNLGDSDGPPNSLNLTGRGIFGDNIHCVVAESLTKSEAHLQFISQSRLDKRSMQGFWTYTSERFFYLEELIQEGGLKDVFHLENDVMLYADLSPMLPIFKEKYQGMIGATFDSDHRCIAGLIYISDRAPISELVSFMAEKSPLALYDMEMLNAFKNQSSQVYIDHLPIIFPEYDRKIGLKNKIGQTPLHQEKYSQNFSLFQAIFDAAAIGQYLGGISPRNGGGRIGFVNETCFFDPSRLHFKWKLDNQGRWVPYAILGNRECPIINLHIHSKNLSQFFSKRAL